jgi:hypothetical protein
MTNGKLEKHLRLTRWLMTRLVIVACLYFALLMRLNQLAMQQPVKWLSLPAGPADPDQFPLSLVLSSAYSLAYLGIMTIALLKELFAKRDIDSIVINIVLLVVAIGGVLFLPVSIILLNPT